MRRAIAASVAGAAAVVLYAAAGPNDAPAQDPGAGFARVEVSWTERERAFHFVDEAPRAQLDRSGQPRRITPGDGFVATKHLFDDARRRIGRIEEECTITNSGRSIANLSSVCHGVVHLPGGQLTATFSPDFGAEERTVAVTGGTGQYAGATGTISGSGADPVVRATLLVPNR